MNTEKEAGKDRIGGGLERVRSLHPILHCITNYVTINDVANALLAVGARPVMADDSLEAAEITAQCHGLTINMGTLHRTVIPAMEQAGREAARLGHPIVLDPVGAGSSGFRLKTALELLAEIPFTAVRGNLSEVKSLAWESRMSTGVDQRESDRVTGENFQEMAGFVRAFSQKRRCITVVTGSTDLVSDGEICCAVYNGRPEMASVTGTGCQLSALLAAFLAAADSEKERIWSAVAAVGAMGLAGEIAWEKLQPGEGNGTYRNRILDALCRMTGEQLTEGIRYEVL